MGLEVGAVVEGKVTGITKFGAFVSVPEGKSGLVHISEVANTFVSDIHEHVQLGQTVKVKILGISDDGKINLSIKRALIPENRSFGQQEARSRGNEAAMRKPRPAQAAPAIRQPDPPGDDQDFEDRLKKFMKESDSRIADNRIYSEHKQRSRRR